MSAVFALHLLCAATHFVVLCGFILVSFFFEAACFAIMRSKAMAMRPAIVGWLVLSGWFVLVCSTKFLDEYVVHVQRILELVSEELVCFGKRGICFS